MGVRRRLTDVIARLERDAKAREVQADAALERASSVELLSDDLARSFGREVSDERMRVAQRRAHGRLIESERTRASALGGSARTLWGAANELRAELAGRGTNGGMDRHRHELLGKHGPNVISIAKRYRVTVDDLMRALPSALKAIDGSAFEVVAGDREVGQLPELEPAQLAAAVAFADDPDIAKIAWPAAAPVVGFERDEEAAKARDAQTAKRLAERAAERARVEKARALAKRSQHRSEASGAPPQRRDPDKARKRGAARHAD